MLLDETTATSVARLAHGANLVDVGGTPDEKVALALLNETGLADPLDVGQTLGREVRQDRRPRCRLSGSGGGGSGHRFGTKARSAGSLSKESLLANLVLDGANVDTLRRRGEEVDYVRLRSAGTRRWGHEVWAPT